MTNIDINTLLTDEQKYSLGCSLFKKLELTIDTLSEEALAKIILNDVQNSLDADLITDCVNWDSLGETLTEQIGKTLEGVYK
ncbi:MAG: hypothetical protein GY941_20145 [Planctomycetes bacterium]|nr:hypothetical protein [Planctomycetota bacterium]